MGYSFLFLYGLQWLIFLSHRCYYFQDEWNLQEGEDQRAFKAKGQVSYLKGLIFLLCLW